MSVKAEVVLKWADGEYLFALKGAQIEELQRVCDAGLGVIYQRVVLGNFYFQDLKHTIRLALIGGGMGAVESLDKVNFYVGGPGTVPLVMGPDSPLTVAKAILNTIMVGLADLEVPKGEAQAGASPAGGTSQNTEQPSSKPESIQEQSEK